MLICAMVITSASITRTTSGLHFTHYYFVAFIPVLIDELIRMKVRFKPLLLVLLLYTSYRVMIRPAHDLYRVVDSISAGQPEHFFFDRRMLTGSTAPFPDDLVSFSPQLQAPDETIDALRALLAELRTRSNPHDRTQNLILNLSELTPIYTAAGAVPPTGFPLWFHEKITVFDKEAEQLRRELTGTRFEAILVQGTALPSLHLELLDLLDRNPGYRKFRTVRATPATATGPCHGQCDEYIHIYLKQSTETRR